MSHTNSTPNYNLPQFVGTDKPTWLNDVNGAMSAIDTQMKANANSATTAGTNATTAINAVGTLANLETTAKTDTVSAINEVNAKAGTAQETANTAIGSANATATALNIFEQKFNLSNITQGNESGYSKTGTVTNNMTLAQNSDGSIFKAYGTFIIDRNSSASRSAVAGLSGQYGIDTGLVLTTAPTEAFIIKASGRESHINSDSGAVQWTGGGIDMAIGTNGHVYIALRTSAGNWSSSSQYNTELAFLPCLYFNATFGDTPTPE